MTKTPAIACAGLLLLAGCLENEENILVRPDGSVLINLRSEGDRADLLSGCPLPEFAPWVAVDLATAGRFGREENPAAEEGRVDKEEMRVRGEFARIEDAPRFFTKPGDPYRSAGLERISSLTIEDMGDRKLYHFERRFRLPGLRIADPMHGLEDVMPKDLQKVFASKGEPDPDQWRWLADTLLARHRHTASTYFRESFLPLFMDRSIRVRREHLSGSIEDCGQRFAEIFTTQRLQTIYDQLLGKTDPIGGSNPLENLEGEVRRAMRGSIEAGLVAAGLDDEARNRGLARLEWLLAASDHADDLGDEKFRIALRMPGTIIAGNFTTEANKGMVQWQFEGADLIAGEVLLRATSVVE